MRRGWGSIKSVLDHPESWKASEIRIRSRDLRQLHPPRGLEKQDRIERMFWIDWTQTTAWRAAAYAATPAFQSGPAVLGDSMVDIRSLLCRIAPFTPSDPNTPNHVERGTIGLPRAGALNQLRHGDNNLIIFKLYFC